jgi:hypothetical protein
VGNVADGVFCPNDPHGICNWRPIPPEFPMLAVVLQLPILLLEFFLPQENILIKRNRQPELRCCAAHLAAGGRRSPRLE